jgi:hypothetical protein
MALDRRPAWGLVALVAFAAAGASALRARDVAGPDRSAALAEAFAKQGLELDRESIVWLETPPISTWRSATGSVAVVARARTGQEEPHDVFLADARLSPEGVLLGIGRAHDISDTTAVDEQRPVGRGTRFAYADPNGAVRLFDLAGEPSAARAHWSKLERFQGALTRLQETGRLSGVARYVYQLVVEPKALALAMSERTLRITADGRVLDVLLEHPTEVPEALGAQLVPESTPGNLVTWAVDRVRAEVGDEAMQYVKAIAFSALDVVKSGQEAVVTDKGAAEDIAKDLGEQSLEDATRAVPVDPDIGFPPPPLEPLVKPPLKNEGTWQAKVDDPFIHSLPGLPPTFVTTFIRPDATRKTSVVYVAMWDPRMVQLHTMAGVAEPKSATGATGPGTIPREPTVLKRVCAAMNAGFQALHGEFSMMSDGVVYLPPKPYAATVVELADGSTGFGTWPEDPSIPADMTSYRQNMTPMVIDGKFNPYHRTWWGGTPADWEDKTHTVRTGICQTQENFVAYFYGADLAPEALAQAMIHTRCHYGLALDMNAGHSGLEFYKVGPESDIGALGRGLDFEWEREGDVPEMDGWKFRARRLIRGMGLMNFPRYIKREGRDYFYLTLRHVLPGNPLVVSGGKAGDGVWQTKGLPQQGYPYALARTEVPFGSGRAVVLRVDPRMLVRESGSPPSKEANRASPVVLRVLAPGETGKEVPSLWFSKAAFSIGSEGGVRGATRLASTTASDRGVAAIGVEDESGMLVYVELVGAQGASVPASELRSFLAKLGSSQSVVLAAPWPMLLAGDTDLALEAARLPEGDSVVLRRQPGPGSRRIFEETPVVPFDTWYPLQARRIRYFKKPKDN